MRILVLRFRWWLGRVLHRWARWLDPAVCGVVRPPVGYHLQRNPRRAKRPDPDAL